MKGWLTMKVYLIMKGEYEDRHVAAVTLDPEQAEKLRKLHCDSWGEAEVEEMETDDRPIGDLSRVYRFHITPDARVLDGHEEWTRDVIPFEKEVEFSPYGGLSVTARIVSDSRETALKIALEKRTELLKEALHLTLDGKAMCQDAFHVPRLCNYAQECPFCPADPAPVRACPAAATCPGYMAPMQFPAGTSSAFILEGLEKSIDG